MNEDIPEEDLCVDCEEERGYTDWELVYNAEPLCCDCASARHGNKSVPQEWMIED